MSESPARRTFASIILVASVIPESSHENSPDAVGNRFWSCKICCWTVVIGLVREIQSSSESILLASIYRLSVSKRRAKLLPCKVVGTHEDCNGVCSVQSCSGCFRPCKARRPPRGKIEHQHQHSKWQQGKQVRIRAGKEWIILFCPTIEPRIHPIKGPSQKGNKDPCDSAAGDIA